MKLLLSQVGQLWRELAWGPRIVLVSTALAVLGGMVALLVWAQRPQYKLLYGKLGQKEAGEIVAAIQAQGIPYQLGGDGSAIYVPAEQVYKARMDLAAKGLPGGDGVGFEIFDRNNFGVSDFIQRTNHLRALQGELARTIGQVAGVRSARVLLAVPEHRLLLKTSETRPTASVMVDTGGLTLDLNAVNSIRSLVANAVEGLKPNEVAVVDNHGSVLSEALREEGASGITGAQMRHRKQVEDYLAHKVESLLATVLGPGNAVVRVSAEINHDGTTITEEKYDPESQIARTETTTDDNTITTEKAPGETGAGISANTPGSAGSEGQEPVRSSSEQRKSVTHSYELNRQSISTVKEVGNVVRISAAVFLASVTNAQGEASRRTPEELASLRRMVANALGIVAVKPNDLESLVSLQEAPFPAPVEVSASGTEKIFNYLDLVRPLSSVLIALAVLGVFVQWLKRTKPDDIQWEVLGSDQAALEAPTPAPKQHRVSPELLNELIRQKPENVGATLRDWLANKEKE